jgi:hypothetical protein
LQEIGRDRRAYLDRSEQELELNSVDGRKVCGQPSDRAELNQQPGVDAHEARRRNLTQPAGLVEYGWGRGTVDGDVAAAAAPPPPRVSHKEEGKGGRNQRSRCRVGLVHASSAVWARSVGGRGVMRPGVVGWGVGARLFQLGERPHVQPNSSVSPQALTVTRSLIGSLLWWWKVLVAASFLS